MEDYILQAKGITKKFGGLVALDKVDLNVKRGHVHALVGENGAGKSTMMKVIGGVIQKDSGTILFDGDEISYRNPLEARQNGIAIIHQELSMLPDLNVIENVYMGKFITKAGRIDWKTMRRMTLEQLRRLDLNIDPETRLCDLLSSQRQMVEIVKAISSDAKLIIMDEPNSSLTEEESERLFQIIEKLKADGITIIYVSHKLEEVKKISDEITVLRDGQYIDTVETKDVEVQDIIKMVVGREVKISDFERAKVGKEILCVKNLTGQGFRNISFILSEGEILGFSGLVGSGRSEVCKAIFGADKFDSGHISFRGESIRFKNSAEAISRGFAMLEEDRKVQSIFSGLPIWYNMSVSRMRKISPRGIISYSKVQKIVREFTDKFDIKYVDKNHPISSLSGGNQQKVILARWLATQPSILILDEPTHGVDVGAKAEIYKFIQKLSQEGIGIIFISSEMQELTALCHRIAVMHEGEMTGILERKDFDQRKIMNLAAGFAN